MTAKEYLIDFRDSWLLIKTWQTDLANMKKDMQCVQGRDNRPVVDGGKLHDLSDTMDKIDALRMKIWSSMDSYLDRKAYVIDIIGQMQNHKNARILYDRYVNAMTFEEISVGMGKTYHHIVKLHGQALIEFEEISKNFKNDTE